MNRRCPVTHSCHATQHQQCQGKHHDAAASPNSSVSSYQGQNLPIGRGIRLALFVRLSATGYAFNLTQRLNWQSSWLQWGQGKSYPDFQITKSKLLPWREELGFENGLRALQHTNLLLLRVQRYCSQGALQEVDCSSTKSHLCHRIPSLQIRFLFVLERSLTREIYVTTQDFYLVKFVIDRPQDQEKSQY